MLARHRAHSLRKHRALFVLQAVGGIRDRDGGPKAGRKYRKSAPWSSGRQAESKGLEETSKRLVRGDMVIPERVQGHTGPGCAGVCEAEKEDERRGQCRRLDIETAA